MREEIEILNGDQDGYDDEPDEQKRSMKILLKSLLFLFKHLKKNIVTRFNIAGHIPDSTMIHEARKKRERARLGEYIPVNTNADIKESKSRLIR